MIFTWSRGWVYQNKYYCIIYSYISCSSPLMYGPFCTWSLTRMTQCSTDCSPNTIPSDLVSGNLLTEWPLVVAQQLPTIINNDWRQKNESLSDYVIISLQPRFITNTIWQMIVSMLLALIRFLSQGLGPGMVAGRWSLIPLFPHFKTECFR